MSTSSQPRPSVPQRSIALTVGVLGCGALTVLVAAVQSRHLFVFSVLGALLGIACFFILERHPVTALVVFHAYSLAGAFALQRPSLTQLIAYLPLAFWLGRSARTRTGALTVIVATLTLAGLYLSTPYTTPWGITPISGRLVSAMMSAALFIIVPTAAGTWSRHSAERRDLAEQLLDMERRESFAALSSALKEQRDQMTRELHDVTSHHLTAVLLDAKLARRAMATNPGRATRLLEELEQEAGRATTSLREISQWLALPGEAPTTPQPQIADVTELVRNTRRINPDISLALPENVTASPAVELATYRIIQESLTNALRYAPGAGIRVEIDCDGDELHIVVSNSQATQPASGVTGSGNGVRGMELRANLLGGQLSAEPTGSGWSVEARLPRSVTEPDPT